VKLAQKKPTPRPRVVRPSRITPVASPRAYRLWPESTIVILACGPSLTREDVDFCCGKAKVIAVNDAYRLAPWADALYACDSRWWFWHKGVPGFMGQKYSIDARVKKAFPSITVLRNTGDEGLELDPTGLRNGRNSGYQAINLGVHLGGKRFILLGFDMKSSPGIDPKTRKEIKRHHFFGEHPHPIQPPYNLMLPMFETIATPLAGLGVTVINATRSTALKTFPRETLEAAFETFAAAPSVEAVG
jgi:hypothetical protein